MSVLIKGMDMPKDAHHHTITIYSDGTVATGKPNNYKASDYVPVHSATDKIGLQKVEACDNCANRIATLIAERCKTYGEFAYRGFEFEWDEGKIESEE